MDERAGGDPTSGHLLHNLLLFGRLLRGLGLDVDPGRMMDLAAACSHVTIGRKADFYHAAVSLLVHRREDVALFDAAFDVFWRKPSEGWTSMDLRALGERRRFRRPLFAPPSLRAPNAEPMAGSAREGAVSPEPPVVQATLTYSAADVLRHKDFAELTGDELAEVRRLVAGLAWRIQEKRARRFRPGSGPPPDLRRTLRRNLRHGGEALAWAGRERKRKPRPVVVLADISGSMERYTRLLLLFAYGLTGGAAGTVETFVFGTRLTRITRQLRGRDVDRALTEASRAVPDWSGGTRIGDALHAFNFRWGRRVLGGGPVVLLISDGWDRGEPERLREEMARLQRSCHRLIWLNPLLGSPDYEPLARGMRTALPYVDDFLPVHNLASLEQLAAHLAGVEERRRERRQRVRVLESDEGAHA
jgi:hypothetical protein